MALLRNLCREARLSLVICIAEPIEFGGRRLAPSSGDGVFHRPLPPERGVVRERGGAEVLRSERTANKCGQTTITSTG